MTFIDRAYYISYNHDITIFIDKPRRGTCEPSYTDTDKESNHEIQTIENPKVTRKDLEIVLAAFLPSEGSEI